MTGNHNQDSARTRGKLRPEAETDEAGQGRRKGVTLHMPWGPSYSSYRVVARLNDGRVALIVLAESREEARREAETAALSPPIGARAIATERWVGTPFQGAWQPLYPGQGGYYRAFRAPRPKRSKSRSRNARWGHSRR